MAEYREHYSTLIASNAELAAISVDGPERSASVRKDLDLPFPILCDTRREVIVKLGLLNEKEKGGIAFPAVFAIDRDLVVRFRSVDRTASRASAGEVAEIVKAVVQGNPASDPGRRWVHPGAMFVRAIRNTFRYGTRVPWSRTEGN